MIAHPGINMTGAKRVAGTTKFVVVVGFVWWCKREKKLATNADMD